MLPNKPEDEPTSIGRQKGAAQKGTQGTQCNVCEKVYIEETVNKNKMRG